MAVTNTQIMELLVEMKHETHERFLQLETKIDGIHSRINVNKNNIAATKATVALVQQRVENHRRNWSRVWKYVIGVILTATVLAILATIGLKP